LQANDDRRRVADMLDGKPDWTPEALAANANVFLDDFLLFDVAKPITDQSHLEIEKATINGRPSVQSDQSTCVSAHMSCRLRDSARACLAFFAETGATGWLADCGLRRPGAVSRWTRSWMRRTAGRYWQPPY
jgi:hypothetical protein